MYAKTEKETNPFLAGIAAMQAAHEYEVWPENMPAIRLFTRIGTRWFRGMDGSCVGLRYEAIYPLLDRMGLSHDEWDDMLLDIEFMERVALVEMRNQS